MSDLHPDKRNQASRQPTRLPAPPAPLVRGPFSVDHQRRQATLNGRPLDLPPLAYRCLVLLVERAPLTVTYSQLARTSLGARLASLDQQDFVRWRIQRLRTEIEPEPHDPHYIQPVPGVGYRLTYPQAGTP